jgi:hypothetical protein
VAVIQTVLGRFSINQLTGQLIDGLGGPSDIDSDGIGLTLLDLGTSILLGVVMLMVMMAVSRDSRSQGGGERVVDEALHRSSFDLFVSEFTADCLPSVLQCNQNSSSTQELP